MGLATSADARKASRAILTKMKVDALVSQRSMIYSFDANFFPSFNYKLLCFPSFESVDFNLLQFFRRGADLYGYFYPAEGGTGDA